MGATEGRLLKACYYKLFRRHGDFFMCRQKREEEGRKGAVDKGHI